MSIEKNQEYVSILNGLKQKIRQARIRASISVNYQLLRVYWEIGIAILDQQEKAGWGAKIIDLLSQDLLHEFPDMKGLSVRNLKYMRTFAGAYPQFGIQNLDRSQEAVNQHIEIGQVSPAQLGKGQPDPFGQALLAQISWYHHTTLLDKVKAPNELLFYIRKTIQNGWSRNVMVHQIESDLYSRQGKISNNFSATLPSGQSELVQEIFKDPYNFDFLTLHDSVLERDVENALTLHIMNLLLELGDGFAFMGKQYHLAVGEKDFYLDLLFYHTKLRRYIVIELKVGDFQPEFVGKMGFYLTVVDEKLKGKYDEASIGLILCKTKDKVIAEYTLRDSKKPIGVAEYKFAQALPESIKGELPTIETIETQLSEDMENSHSPVDLKIQALKNKIAGMDRAGLKTKKTPEVLRKIFQEDLFPFFKNLTGELSKLDELFMEKRILWAINYSTHIETLDKIEADVFGSSENLQSLNHLRIHPDFKGFIKAEKQAFNVWNSLDLDLNEYWYDFKLENNKFSLRKLYHEQLQRDEVEALIQAVINDLLEQIDRQVEAIK
jgi:predicted nuclease of restriction endonuclease-like (RecB) superfamily